MADSIVAGFGIRITARGRKTFILTARFPGSTNPTRRAIGSVEKWGLAEARDVAPEWLQKIEIGEMPEPRAEVVPVVTLKAEETFGEVVKRFQKLHVARAKLRSAYEINRLFERYILPEWRNQPFTFVRRGDIARLLDKIEMRAPTQADRVLAMLSKLCGWYQAREESYISPVVRGMRRTCPSERRRSRILSDVDIAALWRATAGGRSFSASLRKRGGGMKRAILLAASMTVVWAH